MELQILISKKGTKVITATNLYAALQLPEQHFGTTLKKWLSDVYEFLDDIRKPAKLKDFAEKKIAGNSVIKDYYLSIELAKLITLRSKSKAKLKYAKWLNGVQDRPETNISNGLSKEQIQTVLELTKAMARFSCQQSAERQHQQLYIANNNGSTTNWWRYRSRILGYSADSLKEKMQEIGKAYKGKSQRDMLLQVDRYELIRSAVIDLFMGMGKDVAEAKQLGDVAKQFAQEMNLEVFDDNKGSSLFASTVNKELLNSKGLAVGI